MHKEQLSNWFCRRCWCFNAIVAQDLPDFSVYSYQGRIKHLGNTGKHGGAITVAAFSVLYIENQRNVSFVNNTSNTKGGALLVLYRDTLVTAVGKPLAHAYCEASLLHQANCHSTITQWHVNGNTQESLHSA